VRLLLSLAHLEGAWLTLKPLHLRHPLVDVEGLAQVSRDKFVFCTHVVNKQKQQTCAAVGCGGPGTGACFLSLMKVL
jgi:hypothetical protein